ncbi:MAG: ribosome biogenesis GTP-binding protein YihA/YsxC [Alphaproteobacteria bacterium]
MMEEEQFAKWLFAQECQFVAGAANVPAIPKLDLPEIAFAGRSNVGKSSLINSLTNRNSLARVSHTPGATKQINFFSLGNKIMLVDLPGHGYAKVSKKELLGWSKLIMDYLKGRPNLKRVCLLIDSRRGIKESDELLMKLLDEVAVIYQIILTKTDKISKEELENSIKLIEATMLNHPALHPEIIATSSREKTGINHLQMELAKFADFF